MGRGAHPEENQHGGQKRGRDDGVQGPDAGVGDERGEEAAGEIGDVHEDEEVGCGGAGEMQDGLAVGDDLEPGGTVNMGSPEGGWSWCLNKKRVARRT